jgi:uncharacterized membrane protein
MGFMMLFWAVVLFLLVWFAVQTVRGPGWSDRGESPRLSTPSAAEILRARYARGEIDRDTFLRMLEDLRGGSPTR